MTEARYCAAIETCAGWVLAKATARGIVSLSLPTSVGRARLPALSGVEGRPPTLDLPVPAAIQRHFAALGRQLRTYLAGEPVRFTVPLDLSAFPAFTASVLRAASRIPYGQMRTYGQLARAVGSPRAARAVGQAMKRNPISIVIPCHRVAAADGLGGYGGGLHWKRRLLRLEGVRE